MFGLKVNSSKPVIENLVPGAQYQVVIYLRKGPLIGPPSDPVTFAIGKLLAKRRMSDLYVRVQTGGVQCASSNRYHHIWKAYLSSSNMLPSE